MNRILAVFAIVSLLGFGFAANSQAAEPSIETALANGIEAAMGGLEGATAATTTAPARIAAGRFTTYDTTNLVGLNVKARDGVVLGHIDELVVDSNGHLDFAIVFMPGVFGGRYVVVPFSTLMISKGKSDKISVVFNSDKEKFYEGPDWVLTRLSDPKQAASVDRYYGIQPYWTEKGESAK